MTKKFLTVDAGLYSDKITDLYAFVTDDEKGEGLIATRNAYNFVVLFVLSSAEKDKMAEYKSLCAKLGQQHNKPIKLIRFARTSDIEVIHKG